MAFYSLLCLNNFKSHFTIRGNVQLNVLLCYANLKKATEFISNLTDYLFLGKAINSLLNR